MEMSKSTYCYKPKKKDEKIKRDRDLCKKIRAVARKFPYYGYRRITHALRRNGTLVNHKKVLKLMKIMNITIKPRRRFTRTTNSNHGLKVYPNLIKNMITSRMDQIWCADITFIYLTSGFVYLAAIIDVFSKKVVGYCLGRTLAKELVIEALKMALKSRNASDLIHHSDKGSQYCSTNYIELLEKHKIRISMSAKGSPVDNAYAESFFGSLKVEEVYMWDYEDYSDAVERIQYFIEEVYNKKRLHSSIGYMPPVEFEKMFEENVFDNNKNSCKIYANLR